MPLPPKTHMSLLRTNAEWWYRTGPSLFFRTHGWDVWIPGALVQLKRLESERQKFSRAPKCPVPKKKVPPRVFHWALHAVACPTSFFPACFGCKKEVVDGIICLWIFEKSIWTAFGAPLARSFAKKDCFHTGILLFHLSSKKSKVRFGAFYKQFTHFVFF